MADRRVDPRRRDRIIAVALEVIAEAGVAGASHRVVAARADVPLGSMTYHFSGINELLREAFERFADDAAQRTEAILLSATTPASARIAIVELIHDHADASDTAVTMELYSQAARIPELRTITIAWRNRVRWALGRHFGPTAAEHLDAYLEGALLHASLRSASERTDTYDAVSRLAAASR